MALRPAFEHPEYSAHDRERFLLEPAKRPGRTEFARDRARIIHSFALRRLAAKTQVAVPWLSDFPRTRLSHSLECAQVGRELGAALGADPDLMEGACLAHDIGHPPFGHNGEVALAEAARECGGFEGNAQSFRLLTRIEAKTVDENGVSVGLNLTRASLDAASKYPWPRDTEGEGARSKKFGVYDDDREIFTWMRLGVPEGKVSLEAQIMDWSDDISYSVHDLEDGLVTGKFTFANITRDIELLHRVARDNYISDLREEETHEAFTALTSLSCWPKSFNRSHRELANLKDLTSQLIGRYALAAERETRAKFGDGDLVRYQADLIVPRTHQVEVALLKAISAHYIILAEESQERYAQQRVIIQQLVDGIRENAPHTLESFFIQEWERAETQTAQLRVIIDQVASLTDMGALALHQSLIHRA